MRDNRQHVASDAECLPDGYSFNAHIAAQANISNGCNFRATVGNYSGAGRALGPALPRHGSTRRNFRNTGAPQLAVPIVGAGLRLLPR